MLEWRKRCENQAYQKFSYISVQWGSVQHHSSPATTIIPRPRQCGIRAGENGKEFWLQELSGHCVPMALCVSVCGRESMCECVCLPVCLSVSVYECMSECVNVCKCMCEWYESVCLSVWAYAWVCVSVRECVWDCVFSHLWVFKEQEMRVPAIWCPSLPSFLSSSFIHLFFPLFKKIITKNILC